MDCKTIDLTTLDRAEAYKLMTTAIVPRPIGWISTISKEGVSNVAPFSWFNAVCADPAMVVLAVGKRKGDSKDTARNIRDTGELVVNVVGEACVEKMVQTSGDYPYGVSEIDTCGLTPIPSDIVRPVRIAESPLHIECKLEQIIGLGNNATDLIIARCERLHVAASILGADGRVDATKLRPVGRLGRDEYAVVTDFVRHARPEV